MPVASDNARQRREALRELLLRGPLPNQRLVVERLRRKGFGATQSSVSRDLSQLGAIKTVRGYELPGDASKDDEVARVAALLRGVTPTGPHLLVINTAIGAAQRVALALDRSGWKEIAGTVAGDDTIFVATRGAPDQRRLIKRLQLAGGRIADEGALS